MKNGLYSMYGGFLAKSSTEVYHKNETHKKMAA
jgi:hypothetical protein